MNSFVRNGLNYFEQKKWKALAITGFGFKVGLEEFLGSSNRFLVVGLVCDLLNELNIVNLVVLMH